MGYTGVRNCYSRIRQKMSGSPGAGVRMPQGGPFGNNNTYLNRLTTWNNAGRPLAPSTATLPTATPSKNSAVLGATFDTNTLSGGSYFLEYGLTTGYGTTLFNNVSRNSTAASAITGSTPSNLLCNRTYFYRARATNGGGSSSFTTSSFSTTACTAPVISGSTATVNMSEDGSPTAFAAPNLSVSEDDSGTLNWSVSSQPVIQGTATAAGSATATGTGNGESIGYTPPLNFVGVVEFTVRVTNSTTSLFDDHTITVNVTAVNDPPEITEGAGPLALAATIEDTATMHTLNATDPEMDAITWTVESGPNHGMVTFPAGTSNAKTFTFMPGADATATAVYTVRATSLSQLDEIVINVPITARNDAPSINAVGAQAGTEGVALMITPVVVDPDDNNNGTDLTWSFVSGQQPGMLISNTGVVTWTPPLGTPPPPATFNQMYPITIQVQDDGTDHGMPPAQDSFTITVNPPDTDADMVAEYNDYCPGATPSATSTDSTNADNDLDGTRGSDADPNDTVGGDVCDTDDDNDGMPDTFEDANSFDKFNAADAGQDADGDGVSNLDEFTNGTNPNLRNLAIDATGYFTPFDLTPPEPTSIHLFATAVTANDYGPYRPGDNTITWTPSNNSSPDLAVSDVGNLVSNPPEQPFYVRPLVNFAVDQQVEENTAAPVTVTVTLNGDAPSWPATAATVDYTLSGSASGADHNAAAGGTITFNDQEFSKTIPVFNILSDAVVDAGETLVFTLSNAVNTVIGSSKTHRITIVEGNVTHGVELQYSQGGFVVGSTYAASGAITIDALVSDVNSGQAYSYDWSGSDNALLPPGDVSTWMVAAPVAGNYLIDVVVTDNDIPPRSTRMTRILNISADPAPAAPAMLADTDGDGIPGFLDTILTNDNLMPDQTVVLADSMLLETEPGLRLRRGSTAQAAGHFGALLSDASIASFGSITGSAPANADDGQDHVGGIYDFEIRGLIPGGTARIVIPLQSGIPRAAEYRKFNPASGWNGFVVDDNNRIASAIGESGACPEPGSRAYSNGLTYLDSCIQLTIRDGGPNDTDNMVNGVVSDPGTVGVQLNDPEGFEEVEEGSGGRMSPLMLAVMLILGGVAFWRRRREGLVANK